MSRLFKDRRVLPVAGLLCVVSTAVLFQKIGETAFHGDESGWIASGHYYTRLLLTGDFERGNWECPECDPWGSLNMQLGKLLIGLPLEGISPESPRGFSNYYDFKMSFDENLRRGQVPPRDILLRARAASAAFGVLCCLLVFVIGYLAHNIWTGLTAAFLLLGNELFTVFVTRAMADVHYNFFLLCVAVATIFMLKVSRRAYLSPAGFCAAIFTALACSVKVTGILIGGLLFLAVVIYKAMLGGLGKKDVALSLASFCCVSLSVVYVANPYFWPSADAFDNKAMISELASFPRELVAGNVSRGSGIRARYPQLANLEQVLEFPNLFPRWRRLMLEYARALPPSWNGNRFASLHQRLLIEYSTFVLEWVFLVIGIAVCCGAVWTSIGSKETTTLVIPLLYCAINYLFIVTFLELNWDRYYLPTVVASRILIAVGIYEVVRRVSERVGRALRRRASLAMAV